MARSEPMKRCPVAGCIHGIQPGQIMCRDHWFALPEEKRLAVTRGFSGMRRWRGRCDAAIWKRTVATYQDATRAAFEYHQHHMRDVFGTPVNPELVIVLPMEAR